MTALADPVAGRAMFAFTVPMSTEELLTLVGLGSPSAAAGHPRRDTHGWALIDAHDQVWGWHPVDIDDLDWCDPAAALASFIIEPRMRARLVRDGFHVVADDDGALIHALLNAGPWSGLPPLPSGPSPRPPGPILPHWATLLDAALVAVTECGAPGEDVAVDELLGRQRRGLNRPVVFEPAVMRRWLASEDAPAALTAMRVAAGWAKAPSTVTDALGLLDPLGCTANPGAAHTVDAHLSDGDWSIGTCRTCWHPMLSHESYNGATLPAVWAMFGDLR